MGPTEGFAVPEAGLSQNLRQPAREGGPALAMAILLILVIQAGLVVRGVAPVLDGILLDPDGYLRLVRVRNLWQTGAWFDPVLARIGPPEGFVPHWTRPFDVLLIAGAWLLRPLAGFETGLYWWGVLISPVLQILSLLALVWTAAPVLPRRWLWLLAFLFVAQPGVFAVFMIGRPDHHGLLGLLFIVSVGLTIRLLSQPDRVGNAVRAGLVAALALWVSVESLVVAVLSIAALGLYWLLGDRRLARSLFVHAGTLFAAVAVALLAERGWGGWNEGEYDRISVAHLTLFSVNLVFWAGVFLLERRGVVPAGLARRAGWSALAAAGAGIVLWVLYPGFLSDPLSGWDDLYRTTHLVQVQEMQPVLAFAGAAEGSWLNRVAMPIYWLGIAVPAVPWLVYRIFASPAPERRIWVFLGLGAGVFLPLAAAQLRWASYPEILLLLAYAGLGGAVLDRLAMRLPEKWLGLARPLLVAALCVWVFLPAAMSKAAGVAESSMATTAQCPIKPLAGFLSDPAGLGAAPKRVLALVEFGPELLYRTPHAVLAIPNHRFQPGYAASYRIMTAQDYALSAALLREFAVDLIVVCPGAVEDRFYESEAGGRSFHQALSRGAQPAFLEPVPLPGGLSGSFKVFALRPAAD
ncbi:MAG: hypothetical protein ACE5KF_02785 [Kiloniellaceae bacterium]